MSKASAFLYCLILKNIFSKNDNVNLLKGFPGGSAVKNLLTRLDDAPAYKMQDTQSLHPWQGISLAWRFNPWLGNFPWRRAWLPTPVFLPGESHGQRSLVGYRP